MGKIALVLACNTHWAPYMYRYINELKESGKEFILIYWDRENLKENLSFESKVFSVPDAIGKRGLKKPLYFFRFSRFIKNELKKEKYEKVIFLGTYACVPALISNFLAKQYKGKYWIDIRDLTYEKNKIFYNLEKRAILHSFKTVVSSRGFEKFLPDYEYGHIHNIDTNIEKMAEKMHRTENDRIRISYIGNVGFYSECIKFIDVLANDSRFILGFYGAGSDELKKYCEDKNITNVAFAGRFEREKTVEFYCITDIIYNNYGNQGVNLETALSNKLYYAIRLGFPILVSQNTYMETICKEYKFGFTVQYTDDLADRLYEWYIKNASNILYNSELWKSIVDEDQKALSDFKAFIR